MIVTHNCTSNGKNKILTVSLGQYPVKDGDISSERNIFVNNAGIDTGDVIA
ncbi:Colanic acid biosynthesis protein [Caenorhabditis elegans]|nr:Colanic acid biosynthesis protein [Caenorhabditis elegans]CTQ86839.1 Colanic acid biosynthesis protein [Caenorhabditis elegans]|eukprot:NP_001300140.1 Uncharacterized protein CELE_K04F1.9 [Caenorhabditis elegans]